MGDAVSSEGSGRFAPEAMEKNVAPQPYRAAAFERPSSARAGPSSAEKSTRRNASVPRRVRVVEKVEARIQRGDLVSGEQGETTVYPCPVLNPANNFARRVASVSCLRGAARRLGNRRDRRGSEFFS